jgi:hypothetical protein
MPDEQATKEELLRVLRDVDTEAARVEATGQEMARAARLARDVAAPLLDLITACPSSALQPGQLDRELASWQAWQRAAGQAQAPWPAAGTFVAATSGAINTAISVVLSPVPGASPLAQPVQDARERLFQVLDRSRLVAQVRVSMARLGLTARGGATRTPPELLDEAHGALERPVADEPAATSVLVTLRESVDATITGLVRRRPAQEKVSGWRGKVLSLGRHCGRPGLTAAHFDRLGDEAEALMNRLSGFKQRGGPRDQLHEQFHGGVTFLQALLDSIDESKLRA